MVSFDITVKYKQNKQRFLFTVILNQTQSQLNFVNPNMNITVVAMEVLIKYCINSFLQVDQFI